MIELQSAGRKCMVHLHDADTKKPLVGIKHTHRITVNVFLSATADDLKRQIALKLRLCPSDPEIKCKQLVWLRQQSKTRQSLESGDDVQMSENDTMAVDDDVLRAMRALVAAESRSHSHAQTMQNKKGTKFTFILYSEPLPGTPSPQKARRAATNKVSIVPDAAEVASAAAKGKELSDRQQQPEGISDENISPNTRGADRKSLGASGLRSACTDRASSSKALRSPLGALQSRGTERAAAAQPVLPPCPAPEAEMSPALARSSLQGSRDTKEQEQQEEEDGEEEDGEGEEEEEEEEDITATWRDVRGALDTPSPCPASPASRFASIPTEVAGTTIGSASTSAVQASVPVPAPVAKNSTPTCSIRRASSAEGVGLFHSPHSPELLALNHAFEIASKSLSSDLMLGKQKKAIEKTEQKVSDSVAPSTVSESTSSPAVCSPLACASAAFKNLKGSPRRRSSTGAGGGAKLVLSPVRTACQSQSQGQGPSTDVDLEQKVPLGQVQVQVQVCQPREEESALAPAAAVKLMKTSVVGAQVDGEASAQQKLRKMIEDQKAAIIAAPSARSSALHARNSSSAKAAAVVASARVTLSASKPPVPTSSASSLRKHKAAAENSVPSSSKMGAKSISAAKAAELAKLKTKKVSGPSATNVINFSNGSVPMVPAATGAGHQMPSLDDFMSSITEDSTDKTLVPVGPGQAPVSLATLLSQLAFLKQATGVQGNDEELTWRMSCKQDGAYAYAVSRSSEAMTSYVRAVAEESYYEEKLSRWTTFVGGLVTIFERIVSLASATASASTAQVPVPNSISWQKLQREELSSQISKIENAMKQETTAGANLLSDTVWKKVLSLAREGDLSAAARKAADMCKTLSEEKEKLCKAKFSASTMQDTALEAAEKWGLREKSACDYHREMEKQDSEWLLQEEGANRQALQVMRSLIPVNIADISAAVLVEQAMSEKNVVIPLELATYLKASLLLHWCVMHTSDMQSGNFLSGPQKAHFEAFNALDVCETRAIAAVLPSRFEHDPDGAKTAWRRSFFDRARALISQANMVPVLGPWDMGKKARIYVTPSSLALEKIRKNIYSYPTSKDAQKKLKEYQDKAQLLRKREKELTAAENALRESKNELQILIGESRDPAIKSAVGVEAMATAKTQAKQEVMSCEQAHKQAAANVARIQTAIASYPQTEEQYRAYINGIQVQLQEIDWETLPQNVIVPGPFNPTPPLAPRVRSHLAVRAFSVTADAEARKAEIEALRQRGLDRAASVGQGEEETKESLDETITKPANLPIAVARDKPNTSLAAAVAHKSKVSSSHEGRLSNTDSAANTDEVLPVPPTTPGAVKINAQLLLTLNRMCGNMSVKRATVGKGVTPRTDAEAVQLGGEEEGALGHLVNMTNNATCSSTPMRAPVDELLSVPTPVLTASKPKTSRSRLLRRLMGQLTPPPTASALCLGKSRSPIPRAAGAAIAQHCASKDNTSASTPGPGTRLSFLEKMNMCANSRSSPDTKQNKPDSRVGGGLSFLDMIKRRRIEE